MKKITLLFLFSALLGLVKTHAQVVFDNQGNRLDGMDRKDPHESFGSNDSIDQKSIPTGMYNWTIDPRFGDIRPTPSDTLPHLFQNTHFTEGVNGEYNTLGNMGSPRLSRLYMNRESMNYFIFKQPYDFFITRVDQFLFANTKSPFTNITYHECGDKRNGEDRISAYFAVNANKRLGFGFKLDYLYGRGYYDNQSTAHFNGTLFTSYRGRNYTAHGWFSANHLKTAENGGLESDLYITNPENFPRRYNSSDIPTNLSKVWNKMDVNTLFYTHKYSVGFNRTVDEKGNIIKTDRIETKRKSSQQDTLTNKAGITKDSILTASVTSDQNSITEIKNEENQKEKTDSIKYKVEFVPVTSFIHTLRVDNNQRTFMANKRFDKYFNNWFLPGDSANDQTKYLHIENLLAIQLHEGFNKWAKAGMKLFAIHEYNSFKIPETRYTMTQFTQNYFTLGAQLEKTEGKYLHYDVSGEVRTSGDQWGEFKIEGRGDLNIPLRKDTIRLDLHALVQNEMPTFYYQHYHGQNAWWDNSLDKIFRTRIEGKLSYNRTRTSLRVSIENVKNYTYFAETAKRYNAIDNTSYLCRGVEVRQNSENIQIISAILNQNFKLGILNWENELAYQISSDKTSMPLPTFSAYSNLYLLFRIAKVLRVEFGADVRYFTKYNAPAYSPIVGQFCTQSPEDEVKIGNYPFVNIYANFHLKKCRFYIMGSHINYSSGGGNYFTTPHNPMNPMIIRLGISWNFLN